ncbi:MAG: DUF192 domain-containing protein [Candidatus Limnocylindria bacterium]
MPAYRYARIRNQTRNTSLAERCRIAATPLRRIFGLHLLPELTASEALLLRGTSSMDTLFMRYPIDVAFLDRAGRVRRVVHRMPPWRMVPWSRGARDCLELPAGTLETSGTLPGDQLRVEELDATDGPRSQT